MGGATFTFISRSFNSREKDEDEKGLEKTRVEMLHDRMGLGKEIFADFLFYVKKSFF